MYWRGMPFRTFLAYSNRTRVKSVREFNASARAEFDARIAEMKARGG